MHIASYRKIHSKWYQVDRETVTCAEAYAYPFQLCPMALMYARDLFFSKLKRGVRSALDGVGLEELEIVPEWNSERDFLCAGGAKQLRKEIDDLARECREARSDSKALKVMEGYLRKRR